MKESREWESRGVQVGPVNLVDPKSSESMCGDSREVDMSRGGGDSVSGDSGLRGVEIHRMDREVERSPRRRCESGGWSDSKWIRVSM